MLRKNINNLTKPGGSLSQRVIKGGFWLFLLRIVQQIFGLTRLVILARILAPHDFGLMGIALLTMSTLETFSQTGFQAALIQKKENIESYLNTAWTVLILRGLLLFGVLYFTAPFATSFFAAPKAKSIIQVIGLSILLQAFSNIGVISFRKELEFNKEFIYQLSGTVADFIVAISAAIILKNVWALVFGILAGNFVRLIVSYLVHPYRPRLSLDLGKVKEFFGFGKWIFGSSALMFLLAQGDDIFVGKMLGVTMLGFYQMAYRISNIPASEFSAIIAGVTFPAYAKMQDNISRLRDAYLKVLQLNAFLSIPIGGGIFILSHEFTEIFLGGKWMPMVPIMKILSIYGTLSSVVFPGPVFMAIGRPDFRTKLQFLSLMILAVLIYPFTEWLGVVGTAIAVTSYIALAGSVAFFIVLKIIKSNYKKPMKFLLLPFINTLVMVLVIFSLKTFVITTIGFSGFFLIVVIGISVYFSVAYLFDLFFEYRIKKLIKELLNSF